MTILQFFAKRLSRWDSVSASDSVSKAMEVFGKAKKRSNISLYFLAVTIAPPSETFRVTLSLALAFDLVFCYHYHYHYHLDIA